MSLRQAGPPVGVGLHQDPWALDAGAVHVVLFTDLDNPVTNAIYPRLGYRPVHDAIDLAFERHVD